MHARAPLTDAEWQDYYELRWRILRAPWKQPRQEADEAEAGCIHRLCLDSSGRVIAAGRLHIIDRRTAQVRYMAVETAMQGKGYGTEILVSLEQAAHAAGAGEIILHARSAAVAFYRHRGYRTIETSHLLFDEIRHYLMKKRLEP